MALIPAQPSGNPGVKKDMEAVAALDRDAELMLRVREGDDTSFALLLERHRGPVIHFLFRMVQNPSVSEELAQEVFLRVYRSRATYEPTAKFTTWLFRIATHLALNWVRDGKKEKGQESLDEQVVDGVDRQVRDRQPNIEQAGHRSIAGKAEGGCADAQVRRAGVRSDRPRVELFGVGCEVAVVSRV
jgi:DNA-directed RNA polymerase specialized sigma24 family protein